jgi:hypothetical protein
VVFLASTVWGHSDPHAGRIDVHIAPDVGATSFGSPLRKRSQSRRNYKVGCWHEVFGERVRIPFPNIFGLTGGECGEGRATVSLGRAPTAPRATVEKAGAVASIAFDPNSFFRIPALNLACLASKPASDAAMTSITHSLKANDIRSCATTKNWSESRRRG